MTDKRIVFISVAFSLLACCAGGCAGGKQASAATLAKWMSGRFHAKQPTSEFFDAWAFISPVWPDDKSARWLYVEQAVTEYNPEMEPYRQRIYKITQHNKDTVACDIFLLPRPLDKWAGGWQRPEVFKEISPKDLTLQEGCTVYFTVQSNGTYNGRMRDKKCKNDLGGAKFVKSEGIRVKEKSFSVSDKGVDEKGKPMWGKRGYDFVKE